MQVVRYVKNVGTMIGPDGHIHRWTAPRKSHPARPENQRLFKKALSSDCATSRSLRCLCYIGSICAPDKATLKAEAHAFQCTTAGPYNAVPTSLLGVGSVCGLGPDPVGIHSGSLAARYRTTACSNTLNQVSLRSAPCEKMTFLLPP